MPGSWAGSDRRRRLPGNWESELRPAVLRRDGHRCQVRLERCTGLASEVDHVRAGDDHSLINLQAACGPCHRMKSSREGSAARPSMFRPAEEHPGLRQGGSSGG